MVSRGCESCYAMKQAHRFSGPGKPYAGLTELGPQGPRWNGKIRLVPEALEQPLHWWKPRRVFVNSMSDLFHEDVPFEFIDRVFAVMLCSPRQTFQILTKRPARMLQYMLTDSGFGRSGYIWNAAYKVTGIKVPKGKMPPPFPYPHVWLGVSVENQATADERIPILLQTPAAVRWVSVEPLLGPVDLSRAYLTDKCGGKYPFPSLEDEHRTKYVHLLDWVVVGGESGPCARPCDLAWIRSIKNQCQAAGVPVFIKQLGARWYDQAARVGIRGSVAMRVDNPLWRWIIQQDLKGGDWQDREFPVDLQIREWPRNQTK